MREYVARNDDFWMQRSMGIVQKKEAKSDNQEGARVPLFPSRPIYDPLRGANLSSGRWARIEDSSTRSSDQEKMNILSK